MRENRCDCDWEGFRGVFPGGPRIISDETAQYFLEHGEETCKEILELLEEIEEARQKKPENSPGDNKA